MDARRGPSVLLASLRTGRPGGLRCDEPIVDLSEFERHPSGGTFRIETVPAGSGRDRERYRRAYTEWVGMSGSGSAWRADLVPRTTAVGLCRPASAPVAGRRPALAIHSPSECYARPDGPPRGRGASAERGEGFRARLRAAGGRSPLIWWVGGTGEALISRLSRSSCAAGHGISGCKCRPSLRSSAAS